MRQKSVGAAPPWRSYSMLLHKFIKILKLRHYALKSHLTLILAGCSRFVGCHCPVCFAPWTFPSDYRNTNCPFAALRRL